MQKAMVNEEILARKQTGRQTSLTFHSICRKLLSDRECITFQSSLVVATLNRQKQSDRQKAFF